MSVDAIQGLGQIHPLKARRTNKWNHHLLAKSLETERPWPKLKIFGIGKRDVIAALTLPLGTCAGEHQTWQPQDNRRVPPAVPCSAEWLRIERCTTRWHRQCRRAGGVGLACMRDERLCSRR